MYTFKCYYVKNILGIKQTPSYSQLDQEAISPQHVYTLREPNVSSLLSYSRTFNPTESIPLK